MIYGTIASNRKIHVDVWPPSSGFFAEVEMFDTAGILRFDRNLGVQYSSDGVNWQYSDFNNGHHYVVNVTGSTKWYLRQNPAGPTMTEFSLTETYRQTSIAYDLYNPSDVKRIISINGGDFAGEIILKKSPVVTIDNIISGKGGVVWWWYDGSTSGVWGLDDLKTVGTIDFSKSEAIDPMKYDMFKNCKKLETVEKLMFNPARIDFTQLFYHCEVLKSINYLHTEGGEIFVQTFAYCEELEHLNQLYTSNGKEFNQTFGSCKKLKCLTSIDTSNATTALNMFISTPLLTAPDAADKLLISAVPGINWTNPNPCP